KFFSPAQLPFASWKRLRAASSRERAKAGSPRGLGSGQLRRRGHACAKPRFVQSAGDKRILINLLSCPGQDKHHGASTGQVALRSGIGCGKRERCQPRRPTPEWSYARKNRPPSISPTCAWPLRSPLEARHRRGAVGERKAVALRKSVGKLLLVRHQQD